MHLRQKLISYIRGYYLTHIISAISRDRYYYKRINKSFLAKNKYYENIFNYLHLIGLVKKKKNFFSFSQEGKKLFLRHGSINIIHSYKNYFFNLFNILKKNKISKNIFVDRSENILGSGKTNSKKFFYPTLNFLKKNEYSFLHDVGCGNGAFLELVKKKKIIKNVSGSDLSFVSIKELKKKNKNIQSIQCNALNVKKWSNWVNRRAPIDKKNKILISLWFILHEINQRDLNFIIVFFKKIYRLIPRASILIGEIIKPEYKKAYPKLYNNSVMPEYNFFHFLSGQNMFTLKELLYIKKKIPYKIKNELLIDKNYLQKKDLGSSGLVWLLEPKK